MYGVYRKKVVISGGHYEFYQYEKQVGNVSGKRSVAKRDIVIQAGIGLSDERRHHNLLSTKRSFVRRVLSHVEEHGAPLLVTVTYGSDVNDLGVGHKDMRAFILRLRKFCSGISYAYVPEWQGRSGRLHFHILLWGFMLEMGSVRQEGKVIEAGSERSTRFFARTWRKGYVDVVRTDGSGRLAFYLAKYMSKAYVDVRLRRKRAYVFSLDFSQPMYLYDESVDMVRDYGVPLKLLKETAYNSRFCGKVKYQSYARI